MLWPAVEPTPPLPVGSDVETELRGNHYPFAMRGECLAHELFVGEWAVSFRRIEECHAAFDCCPDHSYGLLLFDSRTVAIAQPHATESQSRDLQSGFPQFARLH